MGGFKPPEVTPMATCMADLIPIPLDTAKAGLQGEAKLTGKGPAAQCKGLRHHGEDGGTPLQRQMGFGSIRIGLYDSAKRLYTKDAGLGRRLHHGGHGGGLHPAHRRGEGTFPSYQGTVDAYRTMAKEEGVHGLWKDNLPCHFTSAFGDGFCATLVAFPVDVVKMRYVNGAPGQHSSVRSCAFALLRSEGAEAFYKGFLQLGSWNIVMFVTYEELK